MSPKQREQFNVMRHALIRIAHDYKTPAQIYKTAENRYGLSGSEALQYAYENIQAEAKAAVRGVRVVEAAR